MTQNSITFKHITKTFPGVRALDDVSFRVEGGNVVALVGENGAGKSTLLKILGGDYQPTSGEYLINDQQCHFRTPHEAIKAGVGIISQERQIVPTLTVAENVFMEELPQKRSGLIDFHLLNSKTQALIDTFGLPFKPTDKVKHLSVAYQQMVEIMKACRRQPKIIAFDEPTASLSDAEIKALFERIEFLKAQGLVVLYVSHRMKEIFQIADHVIVLKDGKYVAEMETKDVSERDIVRQMVGRNLGDVFSELERATVSEDVILQADGLTNDNIKDVSFTLHKGEILGFAGLVGAGRTETIRAIFGADAIFAGKLMMDGKEVRIDSPERAIAHGLALCPEDRKDQGIIGEASILHNISVAILNRICKFGFLDRGKEKRIAQAGIAEFSIRTPSCQKKIRELSGGNQQKVILSRWMATKPRVLMLDEPTKGIDVGSKAEIYKMICQLAARGLGIILISSELPEILGLSDRILVMCQGRVTGELTAAEATEEKVLTLAMADMMGRGGLTNEPVA